MRFELCTTEVTCTTPPQSGLKWGSVWKHQGHSENLNRTNIFPTSQLMTHTCISDRLLCARECQTPTHTSTRRLSLSWSYCCNISFYEQAFLFQVLSEVWLRGATWQRNHLTVACSKANLCIAAYVRVHLILYNNWSLLFRWVLCGHGSPRGVAEWYVSHISLHGWQKMTVPYSYLYRKGFSDCKCTGVKTIGQISRGCCVCIALCKYAHYGVILWVRWKQ